MFKNDWCWCGVRMLSFHFILCLIWNIFDKLHYYFRVALQRLLIQQRGLLLLAVRTSCDLVYAVHYLPEGFLWSTKLKTWQVGALGMVSAAIGIFQSLSSWTKMPSSWKYCHKLCMKSMYLGSGLKFTTLTSVLNNNNS